MVYDPDLNLIFIGTGNAALFNWYERSPSGGDNLFLCSILAIDPDTGELVWYYQQVPREGWDYTATQPMILADLELDGEVRQVLMQAPKAGFFYILDRATGELLSADPYVPVNWATHVDLASGRPNIDLEQVDYKDGPVFVEPSGMGGHAWNPMAFNPENGIVYIPAIEGGAITYDPTDGHVYRPKQANSGNSTLFGDSMLADPAFQPPAVRTLLTELQASGAARQRAALKAFDRYGQRIDEALELTRESASPGAKVIYAGLERHEEGTERVMKAIENQGLIEMSKLEKGLVVLATLTNIAPLLGFLGTVVGMKRLGGVVLRVRALP